MRAATHEITEKGNTVHDNEELVLMFVKDLFPLGPGSQPERAELVAEQWLHKSMSSRTGIMPDDLAELIRIAGEWQGGVKPSQGVLARLQGRTPPGLRGR